MTNKDRAQALIALAEDAARAPAERHAALDELGLLRRRAKCSLSALGVREDVGTVRASIPADADPLDEDVLAVAEMPEEDFRRGIEALEAPASPPKKPAQGERGLISAEVRRLLRGTELPYSDIEAAVRAAFPEARTTARSIASVAADLRRAGEAVSHRRGARP